MCKINCCEIAVIYKVVDNSGESYEVERQVAEALIENDFPHLESIECRVKGSCLYATRTIIFAIDTFYI